jgi:hypothetical protein
MNSNNCHPAFPNLDCLGDESPVEESQTLESRMVPMRKPGPARALAPAEIDWSQVEVLLPARKMSVETLNVTESEL